MSQGHPAVQGVFRNLMWFFLCSMCLLRSLIKNKPKKNFPGKKIAPGGGPESPKTTPPESLDDKRFNPLKLWHRTFSKTSQSNTLKRSTSPPQKQHFEVEKSPRSVICTLILHSEQIELQFALCLPRDLHLDGANRSAICTIQVHSQFALGW